MKTALLALLLAGCTAMPDVKVDNFPQLKTTVVVLQDGDVYQTCAPMLGGYMKGIFSLPLACANVNLEAGTCTIYIGEHSTPETLVHEKKHCEGYWHDDGLQIYYDRWKKGK